MLKDAEFAVRGNGKQCSINVSILLARSAQVLVVKIPEGQHVTIFDKYDGTVPPIKIVLTPQGGIGIEADHRYGILRSNAKNHTPKGRGGTDAKSISA